ncbi:transposase [Elusimicrobiota bacterium]
MVRPLRIEYPGAWYHVMNRGRRREEIFDCDEDYQIFINLLKESTLLWKVKISGYCLMSNHYHLLINTPQGNLSRCMRHINGLYTQKYNKLRKTDGQLFRGRYKSILVSSDEYLLEVLRYIHLNPKKVGVVENIADYRWSSHIGYLKNLRGHDWVYKEIIKYLFISGTGNWKGKYIKYMLTEEKNKLYEKFDKNIYPSIIGNNKFKEEIRMGHYKKQKSNGLAKKSMLKAKASRIIESVCRYYNQKPSDLYKKRRGVPNEARDVAIYLLKVLRGDKLLDIGKRFDLYKYSSVSNSVNKIKYELKKDKALNSKVGAIINEVDKSQQET